MNDILFKGFICCEKIRVSLIQKLSAVWRLYPGFDPVVLWFDPEIEWLESFDPATILFDLGVIWLDSTI